MFNNEIYEVYDKYVNMNKDIIYDKMLFLEDFRNREEQLKEYYLSLSILEKTQSDISFSILKKEFESMKNNLKNFNCDNIQSEIKKVYEYIYLLEEYGEEIKVITKKIGSISNLWNGYLERTDQNNKKIFEDFFNKQYSEIIDMLDILSLNEISTVVYKIDKLKEYIQNIVYCSEKIKLYKEMYIFLGDKGSLMEDKLENLFSDIESTDINDILSILNNLIAEVEEVINESEYGIIGFPVYKAMDCNDQFISRYTLMINGSILKIDPFFNNPSLEFTNTGEYFYFDNFPCNGVFSGREIIDRLNVSKDYISFTLKYSDMSEKISNISLVTILIIVALAFMLSNIIYTFMAAFITLVYFLSYKNILFYMKDILHKKYDLKDPFIFRKFEISVFSIGEDIDSASVIKYIIKNFDNIFTSNLKGDYVWIKKYQYQKSH